MSEFAKGGLITGHSDSIPMTIRLDGYMLSARAVRELGGAACLGLLAKLNAPDRDDGPEQ